MSEICISWFSRDEIISFYIREWWNDHPCKYHESKPDLQMHDARYM